MLFLNLYVLNPQMRGRFRNRVVCADVRLQISDTTVLNTVSTEVATVNKIHYADGHENYDF